MESITLTFGTMGSTQLSVSSVQNNYDKKNLLPIVIEENGPQGYTVNIFEADHLNSVFPFFKATETSFFKFKHNDKMSSCLRVQNGGQISSFPIKDKIYGLEILNENKQKMFEQAGGHHQKNLIVWFGVYEGYDDCGIYNWRTQTDGGFNLKSDGIQTDGGRRTETDGGRRTDETDGYSKATVALNNSSTEKFRSIYFKEPYKMNQRTFNFCFKKFDKMMDNLYIN
ncbi:hypothetical protein IIV30_046R [Invertebrate iridescent virus 30]|uniref:Uncharacterized protein n=1 Tax=Invertebrate iridescent virus 30 TaxID=345585 RepID=W8W255_9VIRU|nr:hypothetical protein IIV30_046R [Invertebrate iridescent virus 30]CCV02241.1 hypothetical protein IIV30_046R [Invertebrate iridescent virus 30]